MEAMSGDDPLALLPELVLVAGVVATLVVGLWSPRYAQHRARWVALAALAVSAGTAALALPAADRAVYEGTWVVDDVTGGVRVAAAVAAALVLALGAPAFRGHPREAEVSVLVLLATLGAVALAAAGDLLLLSAAYLLSSVPLYALVAFAKDAAGVEAAMKHYLVGALCGVLLLVGTAALVLATGTTQYERLATLLPAAPRPVVALGVLGVVVGVLFKAGAVPAHFWVPDVTAGTTTPVAALVTTVPKLGAVGAAYRLVAGPFADAGVDAGLLLAVVAAASMTLGNLAAFRQDDVHRLLAYSSISQVGYLLVIAAVAGRSDLALPALLVYLAGYAVTNVGAFAAAAALPGARTLDAWVGAGRAHPGTAVALVVLLLGLVGTPPTAVFVGKVLMFAAAADAGLLWLVVLAAVNTVASVFYYLRWIAPATRAVRQERAGREGGAAVRLATAPLAAAPARVAAATAVLAVVVGVGAGILTALG
jgi:NADH-quinone oxidoreductase subunit N